MTDADPRKNPNETPDIAGGPRSTPSSPAPEPGLRQQPGSGMHQTAGAQGASLGGSATAPGQSASETPGTIDPRQEAAKARYETRAMAQAKKAEAQQTAHQQKAKMEGYVREKSEQAKAQAEGLLQDAESRTAETLTDVCHALHKTSDELRDQHPGISRYTDATADELERLAKTLKERSVGELIGDAEIVARKQPEVFVGGALAIGFVVGRFLRSSSRHEYTDLETTETEIDDYASDIGSWSGSDGGEFDDAATEPIMPGTTTGGAAGSVNVPGSSGY